MLHDRKWLAVCLLAGLLCGLLPLSALRAQSDGPTIVSASNAGAGATTPEGAPPSLYPATPGKQFSRGNPSVPGGKKGSGTGTGWYFSVFRFLPLLALFFLWTHTTTWVDDDAQGLKLDAGMWNAAVLMGGAVGLLCGITIPQFALGLLAATLAYGVPLGLYVKERNDRVPDSSKVMTPEHLQSLFIRGCAAIGINIAPSKAARDSALGPPIRFIGKSISGRGEDDSRSNRPRSRAGLSPRRNWSTTPSSAGRPTSTSSRRKTSFRSATALTG